MTTPRIAILTLAVIGVSIAALGYAGATKTPVVRRAYMGMTAWPADVVPVRAVLLSDLHVAGPDMPPERLARIVAQVNALKPDIVLIAGDFTSDKATATRSYSAKEAVAPLAGLKAPLGTVAVLGNHDHWRDGASFRDAIPDVGIRLLSNSAVKLGPLVIGGVDDVYTRHDDLAAVEEAMKRLPGPRIIVSHSPDVVPNLRARVGLVVAGHTHCGQIRLPLIGVLTTASRYGKRFVCGLIVDNRQRVIVSAGLGTSLLPVRLGVPPDLWLIELGPNRKPR